MSKSKNSWSGATAVALAGTALLVIVIVAQVRSTYRSRQNLSESISVQSGSDLSLIYSADPNDSWNRIFQLLFSRTIQTRLGEDLTSQGPFTTMRAAMFPMNVTARTEPVNEIGDRAIDPMYPSLFNNEGI